MALLTSYIEVPTAINAVNVFYVGEGQYRAIYAKLEMRESDIASFLATTCFEALSKLSDSDMPFEAQDVFQELPEWWDADDLQMSVGGTCQRNNVAYEAVIADSAGVITLYLRLSIP